MRADEVRTLLSRMDAPRIKLCGMSRQQDVRAVNAVRPDLVGFVVDFPRSARNVPASELHALTSQVDAGIIRVGVFVDAPPKTIASLHRAGAIDAAQLHGHEDEAYLQNLRATADIPTIQAFVVRNTADVRRAERSSADLVLLDGGKGEGRRFNWSLAESMGRPYLLAGGLGPTNVRQALEEVSAWGVHMSSGIETDGLKDPMKMAAAVAAVRSML